MERKRLIRRIAVPVGLVLFLALYIEDWGRDFSSWQAATSSTAPDPSLRPVESGRSRDEVVAAVHMAAGRIRNWKLAEEDVDGNVTLLHYVRTNRLLRIKDDVVVRVEDRGGRRVVAAESRARLGIGDLGRNPRTLKRFTSELRAVLAGAAPAGSVTLAGSLP